MVSKHLYCYRQIHKFKLKISIPLGLVYDSKHQTIHNDMTISPYNLKIKHYFKMFYLLLIKKTLIQIVLN